MGLGIKCFVVTLSAWLTLRFLSRHEDTNFRALLDSKNVIITGASSGIGAEAAIYCARMGSNVVIIARRENLLQQIFERMQQITPNSKSKFKYIVADLSNPEVGAGVISESALFLGHIDYLILNHAFLPSTVDHVSAWSGSQDQHRQLVSTMATNFYSYVTLSDKALPFLRQSNGSLLVVSSAIVDVPAFSLPYSVSKSSINAFYTGLRQEFIATSTNVSISIMNFGFIATNSSLITMDQMSATSGTNLHKVMSIFPSTNQEEGGREMVEALVRKEAYPFFPRNQRLWLLRCLRVLLRDPDKWHYWAQEVVLRFVEWREFLASKLTF